MREVRRGARVRRGVRREACEKGGARREVLRGTSREVERNKRGWR